MLLYASLVCFLLRETGGDFVREKRERRESEREGEGGGGGERQRESVRINRLTFPVF